MSDHTPGSGRLPHVVKAISETPWAIVPDRLAAILEIVQMRANGLRLTDDEIRARIGAGARQAVPRTTASVAVLPLFGVMVPRADMFTQMSGATSVSGFAESFRAAVANPEVDAIVIDIDSPGGSTDLVAELADEVFGARGAKPIVAVADTLAASAAYWVGSQADEFVVTPSGEVGSIGVFAAHQDISVMQEKLGVKTTLVRAGRFKADTNPFEPLSGEARDALQARVDEFYGMFVAAVARGRGVSADTVREGFGEGRVVTGSQALAAGMVDRIDTFESTVDRMLRSALSAGDLSALHADTGNTGISFSDEAERARTHAEALVVRARSLADLRRADGRTLSAVNRDRLTAVASSFTDAASALGELVTEPAHQHADAVLAEVVRFERLRGNL